MANPAGYLAFAALSFLAVGALVAAEPSGPLLLNPETLCQDGSGVTHCGAGTADDPVVVAQWEISVPTACGADCALPACADGQAALVAICDIDLHIEIRHVTITSREPAQPGVLSNLAPRSIPAALVIEASNNVTIMNSTLDSASRALDVLATTGTVRVLGSIIDGDVQDGADVETGPVYLRDASLALEDVELRSAGRVQALTLLGQRNADGVLVNTFTGHRITVTGPMTQGMQAHHIKVKLVDSDFSGTGIPGGDDVNLPLGGTSLAAAHVESGTLDVRGSHFDFLGRAINTEDSPTNVTFSSFASDGGTAVFVSGDGACVGVVQLNHMVGQEIVNEGACTLDAAGNWWDGEPSVTGDVVTEPVLPFPPSDLPQVVITDPQSGATVFGDVPVAGEVAGIADSVKLSVGAVNISVPLDERRFSASVPLGGEAFGDVVISARACIQQWCGRGVEVVVHRAAAARPPVALLTVDRSLIQVGETIVFDASNSFSPDDVAVAEFNFGSGWQDAPTFAWAPEAGAHVVSLVVRDERGLESINEAQVTVTAAAVTPPTTDASIQEDAPGVALAALIAVLAMCLGVARLRP